MFEMDKSDNVLDKSDNCFDKSDNGLDSLIYSNVVQSKVKEEKI